MCKMKILKGIGFLLLLYAVYFVICSIVPPLFHRETDAGKASYEENIKQAAERVLCIDDNDAALVWRLRLIEAAQEKLVLSTYDFRPDNSGQDMMAALHQAAERGVKIQIIVDGMSGTFFLRGSRIFQALASHPNVQVQLYNPVNLLKPYRINYRMHDKYLIADDSVYILGGRNTNDLFLGSYSERYNVDREILVWAEESGGSLEQLKKYSEKVWNQSCNKLLVYGSADYKKEQGRLQERYSGLRDMWPDAFEPVDWREETMEAAGVSLLSNPAEPENKEPLMWSQLCRIMEQGEQIVIETPYIICDDSMYQKLTELCGEGRQIQVIVNAVESGANPFGCTDYLNEKENILKTGCEIFELMNGQSMHTKTFLVDDRISIVGSYNLDIRSTYLDTELMLVIDSPELNRMLRENAASEMERSRHVMPDGTQEEGVGFQAAEMPFIRRLSSRALGILLVLFRHLL